MQVSTSSVRFLRSLDAKVKILEKKKAQQAQQMEMEMDEIPF